MNAEKTANPPIKRQNAAGKQKRSNVMFFLSQGFLVFALIVYYKGILFTF